jgi:N-acetylmuramoyl-L-alanine amidase
LASVALGAAPEARGSSAGRGRPTLVVIDPGHGGPNSGARGEGRREKDVALDVARRIAARLEAETDVRVVLTRNGDWHVPLRDRAKIANQLQADAFLSIHCNASDEPGPQGFETWFLSTDGSRQPLHREEARNAAGSAALGLPDAVGSILGDLVAQGAHRGGRHLAESIHGALVTAAPEVPGRGVRQGAYTVLVAATMPATVVEVGFLNHPVEGPELYTTKHRERLARGITDGVISFLRRMGRLES